MSYFSCEEAECQAQDSHIRLRIKPREKDLGEFTVRRVLPAAKQRMIGPFVFFDHMGPAEFPPGKGIDVRPHPHIGIATITYLFDGEILHRDSLGVVQPIQPGAINLMTAGSGIVHSERPGADFDRLSKLHGIQSWIALPADKQEIPADFAHYPAAELPQWESGGVTFRLIMGELAGYQSPVKTYSRTLYADLAVTARAETRIKLNEKQHALYVAEGVVSVDGEEVTSGVMAVLDGGDELLLSASQNARVLLIGGDPLGERHMYWNFVSDSSERIERAKDDWRAGNFPAVPNDDEFIPLPGE
ncbi:pirin family protein [Congregibacter variabilis]|uniref:Pirin family protein n=1 Tax=Congregibacter variabilis TaxID=3081200 RepID=A0ABZ0I0E7_9GAMM|nr:pirin family protein [Congregibacter sp. IMCC43200]